MKKFISYCLSFVIVGIYIVSTMGFGVHECTRKGTKEMMVLFGKDPCEIAHNMESGEASNCCKCKCCKMSVSVGKSFGTHDGQCCSTEVYVLSHDQVNSQQFSSEKPDDSGLELLLLDNSNFRLLAKASVFSGVAYPSGFVKALPPCSLIVAISQFRI